MDHTGLTDFLNTTKTEYQGKQHEKVAWHVARHRLPNRHLFIEEFVGAYDTVGLCSSAIP
eukprot:56305-Eustigmatos_ZCMA.PRE.1